MIYSEDRAYCSDMEHDSPGARLRWARQRAGYTDAGAFAKAMGVNVVTYRAYENDQNGFARRAPEFARKLGVTTDWLLTGGELPDLEPPSAEPEIKRPLPLPSDRQLAEALRSLLEDLAPKVRIDEAALQDAAEVLRVFLEQFAVNPEGFAEPDRQRTVLGALTSLSQHRRAVA